VHRNSNKQNKNSFLKINRTFKIKWLLEFLFFLNRLWVCWPLIFLISVYFSSSLSLTFRCLRDWQYFFVLRLKQDFRYYKCWGRKLLRLCSKAKDCQLYNDEVTQLRKKHGRHFLMFCVHIYCRFSESR